MFVAFAVKDSRGDTVALAHAECLGRHPECIGRTEHPESVLLSDSGKEFFCDICHGTDPDRATHIMGNVGATASAIEWAESAVASGTFARGAAIAQGYYPGAHGPMCLCDDCEVSRIPIPRRHYHVFSGIVGDAELYATVDTIADARQVMREIRDSWRDYMWQGENPESYRITGSVSRGYQRIETKDPMSAWARHWYISNPCMDVHCQDSQPD